LNRPTLSPNKIKENDYNSSNEAQGKKMKKLPLVLGESRSKSGRKKFEDICRKETLWSREA